MNDGPVCRDIYARAGSPKACVLLDQSEDPAVLRAIIGGASVLVTSRFHAMISALATETPVVVAGWSHKYVEVMDDFGLGEFVVSYKDLSWSGLLRLLDDARTRAGEIRAAMRRRLPGEVDSARRNFQAIRDVLARSQAATP
jgi:polysaccharide pyruvyl transferase WcaK-like protein